MKGLIINHHSSYTPDIIKLFPECDYIDYLDFAPELMVPYDYFILSGGPVNISGPEDLVAEKEFLRTTDKPILGICLGLQILCLVFDPSLEYKKLDAHRGFPEPFAWEMIDGKILYNHDWYFDQIPTGFDGKIEDGILTYMEHQTKPIMAFQGHPEKSGLGADVAEYFKLKYFTVPEGDVWDALIARMKSNCLL